MTSSSTAELATILRARRRVPFDRVAHRRPFIYWFLLVVISNLAGSVFNIVYNLELIVNRLMDERQRAVFGRVALPIYNLVAYPSGAVLAGPAARPHHPRRSPRILPPPARQLPVHPGESQLPRLDSRGDLLPGRRVRPGRDARGR
jgi:hypothetical protein